jgi:hypothetical protein
MNILSDLKDLKDMKGIKIFFLVVGLIYVLINIFFYVAVEANSNINSDDLRDAEMLGSFVGKNIFLISGLIISGLSYLSVKKEYSQIKWLLPVVILFSFAPPALLIYGQIQYKKERELLEMQYASVEKMTSYSTPTSKKDSLQALYDKALERLDSLVETVNLKDSRLIERQDSIVDLKKRIITIFRNSSDDKELDSSIQLIVQLNRQISLLKKEVDNLK